ncbi:MAG: TatD family hydrolase, partial [Proteobacteria bacterium]|nr:TatD family hydrolase [Pseudomonadota bacterium]
HAFSGSLQQAEQYLKLGFYISICGTVTYDRATRIRAIAAEIPLQHMVLETDAPDIPPVSHWRQRNSPEYLTEILSALAELRGDAKEEIALQTTKNARNLLGL